MVFQSIKNLSLTFIASCLMMGSFAQSSAKILSSREISRVSRMVRKWLSEAKNREGISRRNAYRKATLLS